MKKSVNTFLVIYNQSLKIREEHIL